MEENNVMNEDVTTEVMETEEDDSGLGGGVLLMLGAGLGLAAYAGVKKLAGIWKKHKAKKETASASERESDDSEDYVDGDCVDVPVEEA